MYFPFRSISPPARWQRLSGLPATRRSTLRRGQGGLRRALLGWLSVLVFLLSACGTAASTDMTPRGRILLWHDWESNEAAFLNEQLTRFEELYPGVTVIRVPVSHGEFVRTFSERAHSGLGPDVILADASTIVELAQRDLLYDLNQLVSASGPATATPELSQASEAVVVQQTLSAWDDYLPQVLAAVNPTGEGEADDGATQEPPRYGVPYSLYTQLLYYRRDRMATPPNTVEELTNAVRNGHPATLPISLADSIWGLRAFGGSWLNAAGELAINGGGLANWIDHIHGLQGVSGFFLDTDMTRLRNRFLNGDADLHIDSSRAYAALTARLGEAVGVTTLPDGPIQRPAGPVVHVDGLALSRTTSPEEVRMGTLLINYLTNPQQQARLAAAGIGRLPARRSLLYNRNLPPVSYELARQVRTGFIISAQDLPLWQWMTQPGEAGTETYGEALAGTRSAGEAVRIMTNYLASASGRSVAVTDIEECPSWLEEGDGFELTLWHALTDRRADALAVVVQNFATICPGATINLAYYDFHEIDQAFRDAVANGTGPQMLLESTRLTAQLAEDGLLLDLNPLIDPSQLQRFIPEAQAAMRYRDRLYGIPESLSVLALFRNTALTATPLITLDDTVFAVSMDTPLALPVSFFYGFWGISAFGDFRFEATRGVVVKADGLARWLTWLRDAQNQPGVHVTDFATAEDMFVAGEAAYFVSGPWSLERIRSELGSSQIDISLLPEGPYGPGRPILQVQGIMVNANATPREVELAVAFGNYLSSPSTQLLFTQTGTHVSALVNVDLSDFPLLAAFREQAKVAEIITENPDFARMEALGNDLYAAVLAGEVEPGPGVTAFMDDVRAANLGDEAAGEEMTDEAAGDGAEDVPATEPTADPTTEPAAQ